MTHALAIWRQRHLLFFSLFRMSRAAIKMIEIQSAETELIKLSINI